MCKHAYGLTCPRAQRPPACLRASVALPALASHVAFLANTLPAPLSLKSHIKQYDAVVVYV